MGRKQTQGRTRAPQVKRLASADALMDRTMKLIINATEDDWHDAVRAARTFLKNHDGNCCIIVFEGGPKFLIQRNKSSITVCKLPSTQTTQGRSHA